MKRIFTLLLVLFGCSKPGIPDVTNPDPRQFVRPKVLLTGEFQHYVDMFVEQARKHDLPLVVDDLIIGFENITDSEKGPVLARCFLYREDAATPRIIVDPGHWKELSFISRQLTMFHELGHCILKRGHLENTMMAPNIMWPKEFAESEEAFLLEFFDKSKFNTFFLTQEEPCSLGRE